MYEISNVLEKGEKAVWEGKPRYAPFMLSYVFIGVIVGIVLFFFFFPLSALAFILALVYGHLSYNVTHYAITNKRTVFQKGIIGRDFKFVEYDKMQNVSVDVGIIDKIFGTGSILIFTGELGSEARAAPTFTVGGRPGTTTTYATVPKYDIMGHIERPYDMLKILNSKLSKKKEAHVDVLKSIEKILKKKL